jgi:hypothetical protein
MSEAQIADALGISAGTVKSYASKGLAALHDDAALCDIALPEAPPNTERTVAVHHRVAAARQRRLAAVAGVLGVLALLVAYLTGVVPSRHSAPAVPRIGEFRNGYKIVDTFRGSVDDALTRDWVPTATEGAVFVSCRAEVTGSVQITQDGRWIGEMSCREPAERPFYTWFEVEAVTPGVPVVIVVSGAVRSAAARHGDVTVSLGDRVPFDQYRFPKRPKHLNRLFSDMGDAGNQPDRIDLHPGPDTVAVPCGRTYDVVVGSTGPGFVYLTADHTTQDYVSPFQFWDYNLGTHTSLVVFGGNPATICRITVRSEHMTGDWAAFVIPAN